MLTYALVSAARNEAEFLEQTIESIIHQTVRPVRWIIVSDGSTDDTDEIVERYSAQHEWIELMRADGDGQRNFGSKAKAVMAGYGRLTSYAFDCIGNLDADITFDPTYYENILNKMAADPQLGLAGGHRMDQCGGKFTPVVCATNSVGGPYQLFRRQCFDKIGGYMSLQYGGIDAVAEISTRMHGWKVQSFPEIIAFHHRCTGTANRSIWEAGFRAGMRDYLIGYHPLFETVRCMRRMVERPYIIYSLIMLSGYFWAAIQRKERPVPRKFVQFLQTEQLSRLRLAPTK